MVMRILRRLQMRTSGILHKMRDLMLLSLQTCIFMIIYCIFMQSDVYLCSFKNTLF
jgi:hypothetical protein